MPFPYKPVLYMFLTLILCSSTASAQKVKVDILLQDKQNQPLSYASITVKEREDTLKQLSSFTDSTGVASFNLDTIHYYLYATAVGYKNLSKNIAIKAEEHNFVFQLEESAAALNEVVIEYRKPLVTQDDDKTVINPESLAEASSNGYEVLEKTPGLFVDQDGNIYLSSTTPALVFINGREMKMSRQDIATMLKSLPPNAIEKIELVRTPSAKYDASGTGGIVNVVLKKGIKIGLTGSVSAGFQQGKMGNQFANLNLSNNNGGTSTYINLNYTRQDNYMQLNTDRVLAVDTILSQEAYTTTPADVAYLGYGLNHEFNDKWGIGYDGRLSYNIGKGSTDNLNSFKTQPNDYVLGSTRSLLDNQTNALLINQDLSSKYKIDTAGSVWENGLSYTYSSGNTDQVYNTYSILPVFGGNGTNKTNRHFLTLQSDLTWKLPRKISVEAGIKSTLLFYNSDADFYQVSNNNSVQDLTRTNRYKYDENINAAYLQGSKSVGGITLKAGLRLENTNMNGRQLIPGDTSFSIHRTDFFPYVFLSKKIMAIAGFDIRGYLVYRRTISRPGYEQLNPFPRYVDQFLSEVGNPALKPQFTHNYEANISAGDHPLIAVGYNDSRDMFTNVFYQSGSGNAQAYRTYDNIGTNKEFYLRGFAAIPPGGRYFALIGGQYNHNVYKGLYENKPLSFSGASWLFFTYHQLKLDKNSQLTMQGFLRLKGPLQFYELSSMGSLNFSVNRKFFKQKLTVTVSANDVFFTNNNTFTINQGTVSALGSRATDSRRFGINFRYNFGFRKKEEENNMFNIQPEKVN